MKKLLLFLTVVLSFIAAKAQYVYKIKADSVLITNDSCTAELIIENSTKNVKGFLVNKGNGRTEFRRAQQLTDSSFIVAGDTIVIRDSAMWKNDGKLTGNRTLTFNNYDLHFKTPIVTTEAWPAPGGRVYIGDSNNVIPWSNHPLSHDAQANSALIISKTKNNNNQNVDFLAMTTSDAGAKNGWLFQNYTNSAGKVTTRMHTYSNITSTSFAGNYTSSAYLHNAYAKSLTTLNPVVAVVLNDYDSLNNGIADRKILHRTLYTIANGTTPIFVIDSSENIGINTTSPKAKLHIYSTDTLVKQKITIPVTTKLVNPILQIVNTNNDTLIETRGQYSVLADGVRTSVSMFIGKGAGANNVVGTTSNNGVNNTGIGYLALNKNTTGLWNTALGSQALFSLTTGDYNVAVGTNAMLHTTSGYGNIAVGQNALYGVPTANRNIAIGENTAEDAALTGSYSQNIMIGRSAGLNTNSTLNNNIFIGDRAGSAIISNGTATGNVCIGFEAARGINIGSNKLYITNSNTSTPLIYGEFDNKILSLSDISGKFGIRTKTPEQALHVSGQIKIDTLTTSTNGTDSVLAVNNGLIKKTAFGYGAYTPSVTNQSGVSGTSISDCQYMRVGNVVTLSGKITIGTFTTSCSFDVSLPIASSFTQDSQLGGSAANTSATGIQLSANTSAGTMKVNVIDFAGIGSGTSVWFTAQYQIL